jgi:hypothetical protein
MRKNKHKKFKDLFLCKIRKKNTSWPSSKILQFAQTWPMIIGYGSVGREFLFFFPCTNFLQLKSFFSKTENYISGTLSALKPLNHQMDFTCMNTRNYVMRKKDWTPVYSSVRVLWYSGILAVHRRIISPWWTTFVCKYVLVLNVKMFSIWGVLSLNSRSPKTQH